MTPEQVEACLVEFKGDQIEWLKKGNISIPYVSHPACTRRLLEVFGDWSFEIVETKISENYVSVLGKLTAGGSTKMAWGGNIYGKGKGMDLGDALKSAGSYALRKAASLFGIGLHLWENPPRNQADQKRRDADRSKKATDTESIHATAPIGPKRAKDLAKLLKPYGWRSDSLTTYCKAKLEKNSLGEITEEEGKKLFNYAQNIIGMNLSGLSRSTLDFLEKCFDDYRYYPNDVARLLHQETGKSLKDISPKEHRALLGQIQKAKEESRKAEDKERGDTFGT